MSLMRAHQRRWEAEQALATGDEAVLAASPDSLHILTAALRRDVERLRALSSLGERLVMKRDVLLPAWLPRVETYLADGKVFLFPAISYCIIWLFDTGEMERALALAAPAIAQGQTMPENFRSDLPHFVADTVLAWAEAEVLAGRTAEPYVSQVAQRLTGDWPVNEIVRAKYLKFAALDLLRDEQGRPLPSAITCQETLLAADALLVSAEETWPDIPVRTYRNKIAQRLRKLRADNG